MDLTPHVTRPPRESRRPRRLLGLAATVVATLGLLLGGTGLAAAAPTTAAASATSANAPARWVATWGAAPATAVDNQCRDCTIRNVVHLTEGGDTVRATFSNEFGTAPLVIGSATVAVSATGSTPQALPNTMRGLLFTGASFVTVPAGQRVTSDPVRLTVPGDHDLLVTTFTPGYRTAMTYHPYGAQDSFFARGADVSHATDAVAFPEKTQSWHFLTGVDVKRVSGGAVVTFGDSITDGVGSQTDLNHRWPNFLAGRLAQEPTHLTVVDTAISGNRILLGSTGDFGPSALSRFNRDVLSRTGVRSVVILEGINDIQQEPHQADPTKITAGLQTLVDRAHAKGLKVVVGTLTSWKGWGAWTEQLEATRAAVNAWVRTNPSIDAVADFDAVTRDPANPLQMLPAYDSGDHLHPNDTGYAAMGNAVPIWAL